MTKRPSFWKCIMGVVVLALLFIATWAATAARSTKAEGATAPTGPRIAAVDKKPATTKATKSTVLNSLLRSAPSAPLPGDDLIGSVFEIDGDITDTNSGPKPDDWGRINCDGGNADVKDFLHDATNGTIFTQGGSKDPSDISVPNSKGVLIPGWQHTNGSVPDKDNILNAYAAKYTGSPNGDTIIAFGADRFDASGDAFFGAWFFQKNVYAAADGSFREQVGSAPAASDPLAVHVLGDILVLINFSGGGGIATGAVYEWIPVGTPCPAGTPVGQANQKTLCDITGTAPLGSVLGVSNDLTGALVIPNTCLNQPGQTQPWDELFVPKTGAAGTIPAAQFFEGAINFDAFPRLRDSCFNSILIETRSSSSPSAQLKDFVLGSFNTCPEIELTKEADDEVICDGDPTTYTYTVNNPTALNLSITLVDDNATPMNPMDDFDVLAMNCAPLGGGSPSSANVGPGQTQFQCTKTLSVGTHTNTAKVVASIGGNSAEATATETVQVVAKPDADAGPDQTVCRDSGFGFVDFQMAGTATNGTVAWTFPGTNTAGCSVQSGGSTDDPVIRCTSFGTATARLTVSSTVTGSECPDDFDDVVLTINPNATAAAGNDQSVCVDDTSPGTSFEVTGTVTAATPVWSITGANSAGCSVDPAEVNSLTATVTCTNLGTATVQLLADSNNACADATDTLILTVNANPEANAGPDQTDCQVAMGANSFTLAGSADHGTSAWTCVSGDCGKVTINQPSNLASTVSFNGAGSATLRLTTTSNSTPSCGSAQDEVVLTVDPNPTVTICGDEACSTDEILVLTANVSPSSGTITYLWSGPAGGIVGANNGASIQVALPGTYTVNVTRTASAGSDACPAQQSMHVGLCPGGVCSP